MRLAAALGLALASLSAACVGDPRVVRVYDGRVVEGAFVPPQAYARYLEGVLAEEAGDLRGALTAYERAAREDDEDPEPLARAGDVRCRMDPKDARADAALGRALRIDPGYAPAIAVHARCMARRGRPGEGVAALERIARADRASPSIEALVVRLAARRADADADREVRRRAIALTVASGERAVAWEALVAWGRGKSDPELLARGLAGLVRVAPERSREVEAGALELLGLGQTWLARRVAGAVADLPPELGVTSVRDATVARLAVDEAILAGELDRAERRATRGHVPLSEVAARALLLERHDLAAQIARGVVSADPRSGCGAMVLAAIAARAGVPPSESELYRPNEPPQDRPAATCVFALAERLAALGDVASARTWAARVAPAPIPAHDPVAGPLAVDLAARGVLAESSLPLELRLELAARRREAPPPLDTAAIEGDVVDAKHALLWHTLLDPAGARARSLLGRLYGAFDRDPIVGFSVARAALASTPGAWQARPGSSSRSAARGADDAWPSIFAAIAAAPAHPLLLAIAVEVAERGGRAEDVPPAKARLLAVARTPAERALAAE